MPVSSFTLSQPLLIQGITNTTLSNQPAVTPVVTNPSCGFFGPKMPVDTGRSPSGLSRSAVAAKGVGASSYLFHMVRIAARTILAKMINSKSCVNRFDQQRVCNAMRPEVLFESLHSKDAVAVVSGCCPSPALFRLVHLSPESSYIGISPVCDINGQVVVHGFHHSRGLQ